MKQLIHKSKMLVFFLGGIGLITACGGGDGTATSTTETGRFIDAAVEGITYTSGTKTGETTADGSFEYETGSSVTFSVGDIEIGTASGSAIITPVQLVASAIDETNPTVVNIVQFLLTIDDDADPNNGIQITDAIRTAAAGLSLDFASTTFDMDADVVSAVAGLTSASSASTRPLVNETVAASHLSDSLFSIIAGTYSGTYDGTDSGTWTITIATDGSITGSGSGNFGAFIISGNTTTAGTADATAAGGAGDSGWDGGLDITTGTFSGTWAIPGTAEGGSFSGSKN